MLREPAKEILASVQIKKASFPYISVWGILTSFNDFGPVLSGLQFRHL